MSNGSDANDLTAVIEQFADDTEGETVSFDDLLGSFGQRAFGPLLLVPAVIAVAPTGAIPGMSILTGSIIALVSAQLLLSRQRPWLPRRLLRFSFSRERLVAAIELLKPYTRWIDKLIRPRLGFALNTPFIQMIALLSFCLGLSMFPLALLPFAVAVPGTSVALLALGLTARDGVLVLLGFGLVIVFGATLVASLTNLAFASGPPGDPRFALGSYHSAPVSPPSLPVKRRRSRPNARS